MDRIEALLDAIGKLNGVQNPDSVAYGLRNPLLVRSYGRPGQHEVDELGRRKFSSYLAGYQGSYFDLQFKIGGGGRAQLAPDSTLTELLATYGLREILAVDQVVRFLKRALKDESLSRSTPLSFFITEK